MKSINFFYTTRPHPLGEETLAVLNEIKMAAQHAWGRVILRRIASRCIAIYLNSLVIWFRLASCLDLWSFFIFLSFVFVRRSSNLLAHSIATNSNLLCNEGSFLPSNLIWLIYPRLVLKKIYHIILNLYSSKDCQPWMDTSLRIHSFLENLNRIFILYLETTKVRQNWKCHLHFFNDFEPIFMEKCKNETLIYAHLWLDHKNLCIFNLIYSHLY